VPETFTLGEKTFLAPGTSYPEQCGLVYLALLPL
jgi:hypothetical protein